MTEEYLSDEEFKKIRRWHYNHNQSHGAPFLAIGKLLAEVKRLKGVIEADEWRLRTHGERAEVPYEIWGCDVPEHMADKILELEACNKVLKGLIFKEA